MSVALKDKFLKHYIAIFVYLNSFSSNVCIKLSYRALRLFIRISSAANVQWTETMTL